MQRLTVRSLLVLAAALMVVPSAAVAQYESPVMGAWVVTNVTDADGVDQMQHPGLWIYTGTHYSTMYVIGDEARGDSSEGDTDADKLAAYESFIANSGRYEIEGDQITTHAYVAKFPNYMHAFPDNEQVFTFAVEGDELRLTTQGGATITLRRVEGVAYPDDE